MNAWAEAKIWKGPSKGLGRAVCRKLPQQRELEVYKENEGMGLGPENLKEGVRWLAMRLEKLAEVNLYRTLKPGSELWVWVWMRWKAIDGLKQGVLFMWMSSPRLTLRKSLSMEGVHTHSYTQCKLPRGPGDTPVFLEGEERDEEP